MAGPAVRAIFLHVNTGKAFIFFAVAGFTACRFETGQPFCVTVCTGKGLPIGRRLVGCETEAKQVVINRLLIYSRKVSLRAAMFRMACTAVRDFQHPMQTGRVFQRFLDFRVAVEALVIHIQVGPRRSVAGGTIRAQLSMRSDPSEYNPWLTLCRERTRPEDLVSAGNA